MTTRGKYLIKKSMQLGLTLRFLFLIIVFSLFIGFEVYITIWPVVSVAIPQDLLDLVMDQIFFRLICFIFPVIFVITAFSIVFSHRIAGPIYRLENTLDRLIRGEDVETLRLRKGDALKEFAEKINSLIAMVKQSRVPENKDIVNAKDE
jgi:signal transduction histidine kinase